MSVIIETKNYQKRLAIIVPYRDRQEHLQKFLPHMLTYFERDKLDCHISVSIHIVEQAGTGLFNRGKLKNCGFVLTESAIDYVCFHDVDYLPIWADYSYSDSPTRLIWHGIVLKEDYETCFGGVVMFNREDYWSVNGYNNDYWGWGFEDIDLYFRCQLRGLKIQRRDGTYQALPHLHLGRVDGTLNETAQVNRKLLESNLKNFPNTVASNGLSTPEFNVISQKKVNLNGQVLNNVFHHLVAIDD